MSLAPHILPNSRTGYRFGSFEIKDSMQIDGLWDPYNNMPMGNCGELCAKEYHFTREMQDEFTFQSYHRARKAVESGLFADETVAFAVQDRKGTKNFEIDEEPFSVDLDRIATLRPAFSKDGTITAANASSINDGASLLVLCSDDAARKNGLTPIAKILAQASFAQDPLHFTTAPIVCIRKVLKKAELEIGDIDLFEINEAFAVVTMAAIKVLELDPEKVNVNGGAVALGHPIGSSGSRIIVSLIHALKQRKLKRGVAAICIGGGEATAVVIELT